MRNKTILVVIIFALLTALSLMPASETSAQTDSLTMDSPSACPSGGCAAGQRINFQINFTTEPDDTVSPNTQICIYTSPTNWANANWISDKGLITGEDYTSSDPEGNCAPVADEELLFNTYATLPAGTTNEQLEFALTIDKQTTNESYVRYVRLEVIKTESSGSTTIDGKIEINIADKGTPAYVARTPDDCGNHTPCYVNSGDDESDGIGTGLRDAINAAETGWEIQILNNIK